MTDAQLQEIRERFEMTEPRTSDIPARLAYIRQLREALEEYARTCQQIHRRCPKCNTWHK